jgi:hypothetical protein
MRSQDIGSTISPSLTRSCRRPAAAAIVLAIVPLLAVVTAFQPVADPHKAVLEMLEKPAEYTVVSPATFDRLGWELPDGGKGVKAIADAAPGSAFDPRDLEKLPADVGYRAKWHVVRYKFYDLDWDITGLLLSPNKPTSGLATVAFINGGSANWYEFFVDPLNGPAVGQHLAQRVPVLLITIPGNYKPGGWTEPIAARKAAYLIDRDLSGEEAAARNAIMTFSVVTEGVARLIEQATKGPVLVAGHSTGGEIQFLLQRRLAKQLNGYSLGWGTGGPASIRRTWSDEAAGANNRDNRTRQYPPLTALRARTVEEYSRSYIGPLNPLGPGSPIEIARRWFEREDRRRPQFKQVLQDLEHQGTTERRDDAAREIRESIAKAKLQVNPDEVIADLFSTARAPLTGYRRMIWTTAAGDDGHWDPDPKQARELFVARAFQKSNPDAQLRVLVFDVPMSHYGHIERPRQLAGGLLAAVEWLYVNSQFHGYSVRD